VTRPGWLRAAAAVLVAQGLVVAGLGAYLLVRALGRDVTHPGRAAGGAVIVLLAGALFLALAVLLGRRRAAVPARTPAVVLELLLLPLAVGMAQGGRPGLAAAVGGVALVALVALLVGLPPGPRPG